MQSKHDFEAVNWVFQDICNITADFGGKVICFCGNFRQILPVVPRRSPEQVISKTLQKTSFWERIKILSLFINMRLQNPSLTKGAKVEIAQFASQLFLVGEEKNMITDPDTKITDVPWTHGYMKGTPVDLISKIYPFIATILLTIQYLTSCAILAVANVDVTRLNNLTFEMMRRK